jgi:hypothetical protein
MALLSLLQLLLLLLLDHNCKSCAVTALRACRKHGNETNLLWGKATAGNAKQKLDNFRAMQQVGGRPHRCNAEDQSV